MVNRVAYLGAGDGCRRGEITREEEQGGEGLESHVFRLSFCLVVFWVCLLKGLASNVLDLRISVKRPTREKRGMSCPIQ